jgi:hypothetical protein
VVRGPAWRAAIWTSRKVDAGVEHGRDKRVTEHVRVRPSDLDASCLGEVAQAAGGRVPVHPGAAAVEQDRPARAGSGSPVDGPGDSRRQRDKDDLGALAAYAQDPVAMLFAEIGDVRADGLEDPQAEQAEHGYQCEVARVIRRPGRSEQGLELQVREAQRGRLGRYRRAADMLGRRVLENAVQDAGAVEPRPRRRTGGDTVEGLNRRISCSHRM